MYTGRKERVVQKLVEKGGKLLYQQLAGELRKNIETKVWKPDDQIPTEGELMELFNVSRVTVRKAIEELVEDGLLEKVHGKGTFVAHKKIQKPIQTFIGFSEMCKNMGLKPSSKVISLEMHAAHKKVRDFFQLEKEDAPVVIIKRLRLADGKPIIYETNIFPAEYRFLLLEDLKGSLYDLLKEKNIVPAKSVKEIDVCVANEVEEEYLEVPPGTPLLLIDEMVYDDQMQPLHICKQIFRTDMVKYTIH